MFNALSPGLCHNNIYLTRIIFSGREGRGWRAVGDSPLDFGSAQSIRLLAVCLIIKSLRGAGTLLDGGCPLAYGGTAVCLSASFAFFFCSQIDTLIIINIQYMVAVDCVAI